MYEQESSGVCDSSECSGSAVATGTSRTGDVSPDNWGYNTCTDTVPLLMHMLLLDYGIGEMPFEAPPFRRVLPSWPPPRRRALDIPGDSLVDLKSTRKGKTGYTGVLEKMSSEVPTCGTERLERKLRVDVERLIPLCFPGSSRSRRETRLKIVMFAYAVAARHGISLGTLETGSRQIPRGLPAAPNKDGLATEKAKAVKQDNAPASTAANSLPSYEAATSLGTGVIKGDNVQPFCIEPRGACCVSMQTGTRPVTCSLLV
ncbi:hypothetical protein B0T26DRAFT_675759 [Lasiosphaeria miniovina]|uniref:Uncharacterized protein n=1 Tax=Lasiosphaeria miniovina TaxID=1954250 RepID=A0AA40DV15_9PEZI|nr:uncharacterized protein B0T26DRAFT_675759 [Lasiosphaeria miniovina]KAK0717454.1 hypothetical protein B0T26DRAFT_675759 [Lasiosphaeria miniovina]